MSFGASAGNSIGNSTAGIGTERPGAGMIRFFGADPVQRGATT